MDFHVLQTQMEVMMDLIGNRRRIWVTISSGKESDIAACFQREWPSSWYLNWQGRHRFTEAREDGGRDTVYLRSKGWVFSVRIWMLLQSVQTLPLPSCNPFIYLFIYFCLIRTPWPTNGNGQVWDGDPIPRSCHVILAHPLSPSYPAPFSRELSFPHSCPTRYPPRPNMNFHIFFFSLFLSKLYETKKKFY